MLNVLLEKLSTGELPSRPPTRKRVLLNKSEITALESYFIKNPRPLPKEYVKLAESLELQKEAVGRWFTNRRRKKGCSAAEEAK